MQKTALEHCYVAPQINVHVLSTEAVLCESLDPTYGGNGNPGQDPSFGDLFDF
ncbi:MAG: hypothetical protein MJY46_04700 [Bacteroidales bacterium]|nr:hypothetical protein [Bacteroidales bacterium]